MVIDPNEAVPESNESNNQGVGEGVDFIRANISTPSRCFVNGVVFDAQAPRWSGDPVGRFAMPLLRWSFARTNQLRKAFAEPNGLFKCHFKLSLRGIADRYTTWATPFSMISTR